MRDYMRKIIFAINNTIDGYADHTAMIADDELHDFFAEFLDDIGVVLFGRKTYQLMESFWPAAKDDPGINKSMIRYADKINPMKKIIFSKTLKEVTWKNSELCQNDFIDEVKRLQKQNGKNIAAGSLSLATQLMQHNLIDEYHFVVHPIILGTGKLLFENLDKKQHFKLVDIKTFHSGVVVLHYQR